MGLFSRRGRRPTCAAPQFAAHTVRDQLVGHPSPPKRSPGAPGGSWMTLGWGWGACSPFGGGCSSWPDASAPPGLLHCGTVATRPLQMDAPAPEGTWSAPGRCLHLRGKRLRVPRAGCTCPRSEEQERLALPVGKRRLPGRQRDQGRLVPRTRRQAMIRRRRGRWEGDRGPFTPRVHPRHMPRRDRACVLEAAEAPDTEQHPARVPLLWGKRDEN